MIQQFTNELTPAILADMEKSPFTETELANMVSESRHQIEERSAYFHKHPVKAIYRVAVAGSLTLRGGVVDEFNPSSKEGHKIKLSNDQWASVATEGCQVTYPDGSTARILTSAGRMSVSMGKGIALVGSQLDNGDEITSTPQSTEMLLCREGVPVPDDFLAERR